MQKCLFVTGMMIRYVYSCWTKLLKKIQWRHIHYKCKVSEQKDAEWNISQRHNDYK